MKRRFFIREVLALSCTVVAISGWTQTPHPELTLAIPPADLQVGGPSVVEGLTSAQSQFPAVLKEGLYDRVFINQPLDLGKLGPGTNVLFVSDTLGNFAWAISNGRFDSLEDNGSLNDFTFPKRISTEANKVQYDGKYPWPIDAKGDYLAGKYLVTSNNSHGHLEFALKTYSHNQYGVQFVAGHVAVGKNGDAIVGYLSGSVNAPTNLGGIGNDRRALAPRLRAKLHTSLGYAFYGRNVDAAFESAPTQLEDITKLNAVSRYPIENEISFTRKPHPELEFLPNDELRNFFLAPKEFLSGKSVSELERLYTAYPHLDLNKEILEVVVNGKASRASRNLATKLIGDLAERSLDLPSFVGNFLGRHPTLAKFSTPELFASLASKVTTSEKPGPAVAALSALIRADFKDKKNARFVSDIFAQVLGSSSPARTEVASAVARLAGSSPSFATPKMTTAVLAILSSPRVQASDDDLHREAAEALRSILHHDPRTANLISEQTFHTLEGDLGIGQPRRPSAPLANSAARLLALIAGGNATRNTEAFETLITVIQIPKHGRNDVNLRYIVQDLLLEVVKRKPSLINDSLLHTISENIANPSMVPDEVGLRARTVRLLDEVVGLRPKVADGLSPNVLRALVGFAGLDVSERNSSDLRGWTQNLARDLARLRPKNADFRALATSFNLKVPAVNPPLCQRLFGRFRKRLAELFPGRQ